MTLAVTTIVNALRRMSDEEVAQVGVEVFGLKMKAHESGQSAGIVKSPSKSPNAVWIKAITGVDDSHNNGYCLAGDFVNHKDVATKAATHVGYWAIVAKGTPNPTIMIARRDPTATYNFVYPSGATGTLHGFDVIATPKDWSAVHAVLHNLGVAGVTVKIPPKKGTA